MDREARWASHAPFQLDVRNSSLLFPRFLMIMTFDSAPIYLVRYIPGCVFDTFFYFFP